ncbi:MULTISPECIES: DegT/DnrJ/EryC1/StrS family aminotransferase [Thermomonosporaceae]|uniref:DegT/DnrJ/EryC1/StrS family aminotransferase n=1 Tax=Thermomonosporaceae TaxID=2012 RepID=UPI00255AC755|nr:MULTISPECIES: aminotransferase class I/II-fold pyridoxal phosphate-dependent enzyme [Thermomonosporaceae]MDL4771038.1 aminotransferase class I/II-fold pyridoxal phosphate-dependent enzyme [Actinomadura xylanilytica]
MTVDVQPGVQPGLLAIDGAEPVRTDPWPTYDKGDVFIDDEDLDAALATIRSRLYFRYDHRPYAETQTGRLERDLCAFFSSPHALTCASGTTAIALGLLALDLPPGSLVACPAFTFAATPSAVLLAGHRPLFVECDEDLHLDVDDLRRRLTPEVRAIVVVHMRGFASDMDAVCAVAREHGVPVVEDAVPALGASLRGRPLGTFGAVGAFSTQSDKSLNTGEGGFLVTGDADVHARAVVYSGAYEGRMARHYDGRPPPVDDLAMPIFGLRMDEIRAALARSMLRRLPERLAAHHRNYDDVAERLAGVPGIALRRPVDDHAYLGEALVFRIPGADARASAWTAAALRAEGIDARALGDPGDTNVRAFWNWRFLFPDADRARAEFPVTAARLDESVDIPLSANLTERDRDQLVRAVGKVMGARSGRPR